MIAWLFLKFGFGILANVWLKRIDAFFNLIYKCVAFAFAHWRVFLPLAIVGFLLWKLYVVTGERNDVTEVLTNHLAEDSNAKIERNLENEFKRKQGEKDTAALRVRHAQEIETILEKSKRNEVKHEKDQAISDRAINNYRVGLQLAVEREAAIRLSGDEQDRSTKGNGDSTLLKEVYKALDTCEEAGAVAAADYNYCKGYVDSEQKRLGVEK